MEFSSMNVTLAMSLLIQVILTHQGMAALLQGGRVAQNTGKAAHAAEGAGGMLDNALAASMRSGVLDAGVTADSLGGLRTGGGHTLTTTDIGRGTDQARQVAALKAQTTVETGGNAQTKPMGTAGTSPAAGSSTPLSEGGAGIPHFRLNVDAYAAHYDSVSLAKGIGLEKGAKVQFLRASPMASAQDLVGETRKLTAWQKAVERFSTVRKWITNLFSSWFRKGGLSRNSKKLPMKGQTLTKPVRQRPAKPGFDVTLDLPDGHPALENPELATAILHGQGIKQTSPVKVGIT